MVILRRSGGQSGTGANQTRGHKRHGDAFRVLAREGHRSPTVTSITLPDSLPSSTLLAAVKERGFTIGSGYGKNKVACEKIYRGAGAKVVDLDEASLRKWQAIARETAWKDYAEKNETSASLMKAAQKLL